MEQVSVPTDPWSGLVQAVDRRDLDAMAASLADGVVLRVPPLHLTLTGREDVLTGIARVIDAFPDLAYRTKSRYLAPRSITDEAITEGTQNGSFLGSPATGRSAALPMRMIVEHDDRAVTMITIYPDVASLRTLGGATARHIDLTATNLDASSPLVSALRASMQQTSGRVIVGTSRDVSAAPTVHQVASSPATPDQPQPGWPAGRGPNGRKLKSPVPRRVRRTRGRDRRSGDAHRRDRDHHLGGHGGDAGHRGSQARSQAIASTPAPSPSAAPTTTPPAPTASASVAPPVTPPATPSQSITVKDNQVTLSSDLLFDYNSAVLTRNAKVKLAQVVSLIRSRKTGGTVTVTGYTDSDGTRQSNLVLSQKRARAVAFELRKALAGLNITVRSYGLGQANPVDTTGTKAGKQLNRRVTINIPPATG